LPNAVPRVPLKGSRQHQTELGPGNRGASAPFGIDTGRLNDMAEGYCVKDKKMVEIKNPQKITMKNGRPATQGTCPSCGGKVTRIGA